MEQILGQLPQKAREKLGENKRYFAKLKKRPPRHFDTMMRQLHEAEFERTDCLNCANCCKTTGPLFTQADVERIAKHLRQRPGAFIEAYLRVDDEGDYVLRKVPCAFLGTDNHCSIYDVRPKACREFPHTDRRRFHQIADLTLKNVAICPAAFNIVEAMKKNLKGI